MFAIRSAACLFAVVVLSSFFIVAASAQEKLHPIASQVKGSVKDPSKPFAMFVHLETKEGMQQKFEEAFARAIAPTLKEKGCMAYQLNRDAKTPTKYVLYERWQNLASLQAHLESKHLTKLLEELGDLLAGAPEVEVFVPADASAKGNERDIFDYDAQKTAKGVKKIVFVADTAPHGPRGNHEFLAAAIYLARTINANYPDAYAVVHTKNKWPKDLQHADAIIVLLNHGGSAVNPAVKEAAARGAGFMAIHYGVEVNKGDQGKHYLKWIGGYFETFWSVNPWWTPRFEEIPKHETTRGVKPFSINDEWYYHMRFVDGMKGVTPILYAVPPVQTVQGGGKKSTPRGGNPDVWKAVTAGKQQVMAWAYERPDKARGFGFTGLHKHANLADDNMRTLLLNAVAWVSKLPVPEGGVPSVTLSRSDLEQLIDDGKLAIKRRGI